MRTASIAVSALAVPGDLRADQTELEKDVVDDAELVVEHPLPHFRRDDRRDRPGYEDRSAHDAAAAELGVEHQRDYHAENSLAGDRDHREAYRVPDRAPPDWIDEQAIINDPAARHLQDREIVGQTHPLTGFEVGERGVGEAEIDRSDERPAGDGGKYDQHRDEEQPRRAHALAHQL
jgi:hypothetical protein